MELDTEQTSTKTERQVQFWAALGPLFFLITLMIANMQHSPGQWLVSVTALISIPLCMQWRLKGAALAIAALITIFLANAFELSIDLRMWQGGVVSAFSLAAIVTALSYDEMGEVLDAIQMESKSRLKTLFNLDQKLNDARAAFEKEKALVKKEYTFNQDETTALKERVESLTKQCDELNTLAQKDKTDLTELQQNIVFLNEKLKSKDVELKALTSSQKDLKEAVYKKELEQASLNDLIDSLERQCRKAQDQESILKQQLIEKQQECKTLEELFNLDETEKSNLSNQLAKLTEEKKTFEELLSQETNEKSALTEQVTKLEEETQKLKETFFAKEQELVEQIESLNEHSLEIQEKLLVAKNHDQEREDELLAKIDSLTQAKQDLIDEINTFQEEQKTFISKISAGEEREELLTKLVEAEQEKNQKLAEQKPEKAKESTEIRRLKGLHKQLQQQFDEKCEVLDDARRGQFRMQERLLNLQREAEENKRKEKSEFEALLEDQLAKADKEHQQVLEELQNEIEHLHDVIATLSVDKKELQESLS